jgi:hypothetical protein
LFSRLRSLVSVLLSTELALRFGHISCWCVLTCGVRTGGDCLRLNEAISKDGSGAAPISAVKDEHRACNRQPKDSNNFVDRF